MGLDMFLSRRIYVSSNGRAKLSIQGNDVPVQGSKVKWIEEEAGYWRKANAIHQWFVENVQNGNDDCQEYDVSTEQLQSLLDLVEKVLADHSLAEELLPTQEGFFFGGTEYDEYYFQDLEETKKILMDAIKDNRGYYTYQSSW